jgi:chemotaxis family two-component system response regulator Rcp1
MNDANETPGRRPRVLLVEDNDNDVELTRLAFAASGAAVELQCVGDGEQCMEALRHPDSRPDLILLDLHMPRMDGLEVLQALAGDETLKRIPVVVLTTSDARDDVEAAYRLGCNSYLLKPIGFEAFAKLIANLTRYWFGVVTLPGGNPRPRADGIASQLSARTGTQL